jgi:hypothetical protein
MISAGRIITIFRKKGGSGRFTKTSDELSGREASIIRAELNGEKPLIVKVLSKDEWFALTKSRAILKGPDDMTSILLDEIDDVVRPDDLLEWAQSKRAGGKLDVRLKDGSRFTVDAESGRPFVALMNVFMYLAKVNGKTVSHRSLGS